MADLGPTSIGGRALDAFVRVGVALPEPVPPIRPADAAKPRFEVPDQDRPADSQAAKIAFPNAANDDQPGGGQADAGVLQGDKRRGGLIGALTSFVAKVLGQAADGAAAPSSSRLAGIRAYGEATARAIPTGPAGVEVLDPVLPRLSSGRVLDLSI